MQMQNNNLFLTYFSFFAKLIKVFNFKKILILNCKCQILILLNNECI